MMERIITDNEAFELNQIQSFVYLNSTFLKEMGIKCVIDFTQIKDKRAKLNNDCDYLIRLNNGTGIAFDFYSNENKDGIEGFIRQLINDRNIL